MIQIRQAISQDLNQIVAFQMEMALESEGLKLDPETLKEGVSAVFLNPEKGRYFVATDDEVVIGSLMITPEWSDWRNQWVYWLQSLWVQPGYRRRGVFRRMYAFLQQLIREDETAAGLRLYVDVNNRNAIEAYRAIKMDGDHYRVFEWMKE